MSDKIFVAAHRGSFRTPWRTIKQKIESLWADELVGRMSIHHEAYARDGSSSGSYWITLDDDVIWDFPRQFYGDRLNPPPRGEPIDKRWGAMWETERVLHTYLDLPRTELFHELHMEYYYAPAKHYPIDRWDLGDILRAADRRLGYRKLMYWAIFQLDGGSPARDVLRVRFQNRKRR